MHFTNIFLFGLVATATAMPQKRGGRRKCSSIIPSTTGTFDHFSTTPILSSSSSIVVTPSLSDQVSTPIVSTPISSSATPGTSSEVASTPISSESSATTPSTTAAASTTPESSTVASSTPGSSNESSTPIASSTDSGSTAPSSTPSITSESSTPIASSTVSSSTIASTTFSASTTSVASTTAASTTAASTGPARPRPTSSGDLRPGFEYTSCTSPGVVGLAFAQGPYDFTAEALDLLDAAGFKATFFLNGNNWGSIYDYSSVVQRMYTTGHQVGSNTWNNAQLDALDSNGIEQELLQLEDALRSIIGVHPTYLLPPNGKTNQLVRDTAANLGYKIIKPDIITYDEQHQGDISTAINNFIAGLDSGGTIALVHGPYQATVETMLPQMIQAIESRGLTAVSLGQCFGRPSSNSYSTAP